jgi:hypothetical protein
VDREPVHDRVRRDHQPRAHRREDRRRLPTTRPAAEHQRDQPGRDQQHSRQLEIAPAREDSRDLEVLVHVNGYEITERGAGAG